MRKVICNILLAMVVCWVAGGSASAEIVTIQVQGVVEGITSSSGFELDGSVDIGTIMTGFATYDTGASLQDFDHLVAYPFISVYVDLGNYKFSNDVEPGDSSYIRTSYDGGYIYSIKNSPTHIEGNAIIDNILQPIDNDFWGSSLNPFMKTGIRSAPDTGSPYPLPDPSLDISDYDMYNEFRIILGYSSEGSSYSRSIYGHLTYFETVPEPGTVLLLGLGGLGLIRKRRV